MKDLAALPFTRVVLRQPARHYRCPRDWSWRARLGDYDLWLVLGGRGELTVDGELLPVAAPQAVLLRPGEDVAGTQDPRTPLEVIALHFMPADGGLSSGWAEPLRSVRLHPATFYREVGERLVEEHARGDALGRRTAEALALGLLGALWRRARAPAAEKGDDRLETLVRSIQREPERAWALEEMCRLAAMGPTRLNARCRELTGFAPMGWVLRCRVERAALLLRETDSKLEAVAEACGYRDVYFFSRQFRRFMGMPPGAWRRQARAKRGV